MERIAVIGNAGGGKSTLCRALSEALDIPLFPIDQIQWAPGWVAVPPQEVKARHDHLLSRERWIIDGWGNFEIIEERFQAADTIIFVDLPLHVHYWWSIKRQVSCIFRPRVDGPPGCPMLPMTWPLMKMIWRIHHNLRPRLLELINSFRPARTVYHITSPGELRGFVQRWAWEMNKRRI